MDTILTIVGGSLKTKLLTLVNLEKWRGLPKTSNIDATLNYKKVGGSLTMMGAS